MEGGASKPLPALPVAQAAYGGGVPIAHDPSLPLLIYAGPFAYSLSYQARLVNPESGATTDSKPSSISFSSDKEEAFSVVLSFEVRDEAGNIEQIAIRPLRSAQDLEPPLALEHLPPQLFHFGIDAAELAKLKSGIHFIRAVFSAEQGADTGSAAAATQTTPLTVELKSSGLTSEQRKIDLQQAARFYLRDRDYAKAEALADRARALDARSVGAWELRGEALLAQNRLPQAEEAFKTALRHTKGGSRLSVSSPGEESADRISKYLEKLRALRKKTAW
jgi:hypothetical protein